MSTPRLILVAASVSFLAVFAALSLGAGTKDSSQPSSSASIAPLRPGASTDARIARQQAVVRAAPRDPDGYTLLASAYLQKVRETGEGSLYLRADAALARALSLSPDNAAALTERGALRLARHDFRGALDDGRRAHRLAPEVIKPYGVLVDAYLELGRYGRAARTLQRMINLKPDLAAYSRVSYFRELHGDLPGAMEAMRLAVSAGGGTPENTAYVGTLLGNLQFARGSLGAAERSYRGALARFPRYVPARAGLARVEAARGRLARATSTLRGVVQQLPLPEYVVALGETELAAGRKVEAARDLALIRAQQALLRAGGVNTDTELAVFEASHGDAQRAVAIARRGWAAAPSVRSADALGWTLTRSGKPDQGLAWGRRALALGSCDPLFLYHAGISARAAGRRDLARRWLARSLADNPRFSPLWAPRARRALEGVS